VTFAIRGRVVSQRAVIEDGVVAGENGRLTWVGAASEYVGPVTQVPLVLPGLVDLHCHGGGGASFTSGDPEQIVVAAEHHLGRGTTSLVGSTVADAPERLLAITALLADACDRGDLAGIHLEGPFLSAARCGAQDPRHLRDPDLTLAAELLAAGRGHVRMVTLAPELTGASALAELLRSRGVVPAAGHTAADAATTLAFLAAGGHVTHLFNGMPPLHHREPGPAGGALASTATLELIADGTHLADETVAWLVATVGIERLVFVSDAMAAAGMPDGDYVLGPQRVRVRNGVARLAEGDSIAGGTSRLADIVARQVRAGVPLVEAVAAATRVPAHVLGLADRGSLVAGARADLLITDDRLAPLQVMRAGEWVA